MNQPLFILLCFLSFTLGGCAVIDLAGHPRSMENVRTTAYTHSERDHIRYGRMSASGNTLSSGRIRSAAADWSRFPVGTRFRIKETGQEYQIDDYGSALIGTSTIDLYKPTRREMNRWGVRFVNIEVLEWGSPEISLKILQPRVRHRHVRMMVEGLKKQADGRAL